MVIYFKEEIEIASIFRSFLHCGQGNLFNFCFDVNIVLRSFIDSIAKDYGYKRTLKTLDLHTHIY